MKPHLNSSADVMENLTAWGKKIEKEESIWGTDGMLTGNPPCSLPYLLGQETDVPLPASYPYYQHFLLHTSYRAQC